jgi:hypothetical protein
LNPSAPVPLKISKQTYDINQGMNTTMPKEEPEVSIPDDLVVNPDGLALFTISEDGAVQGSYKGVFSLRCYLSPLDTLAAGRHMRDLLGPYGASATEQDSYMSFCISQLTKRVVKGPPWWTANNQSGDIPDLNILSLILDRALTAERVYKQRLAKIKQEALERAFKAAQELQDSLNPKKKEE